MKLKVPFLPYIIQVSKVDYKPVPVQPVKKDVVRVQRDYNKVFCIGFNKKGTTTMTKLLAQFGFRTGK